MSNAGWRSTVSRIPKVLRGNTGGLLRHMLAVASSLVVVLGLAAIPSANAAPYRTHSVGGAANPAWWHRTRPSIVMLRSTWL